MDETAHRNELVKRARVAYWKVLQNGFTRVINEAPTAYKGPDAAWYRTEQKMMARHMEPLYWGACVSIFLFGTFRISGSNWYARVTRQASNGMTRRQTSSSIGSPQGSVPALESIPKPSTATTRSSSNTQQWQSFLDQKTKQEASIHDEAWQLPFDMLVSALCGVSSVLWLSQPRQALQDLAEAPLVTGKSFVVECLCAEMETALVSSVSDSSILTEESLQQDDTLRLFCTMVQNCRIRAEYIRIRTEQGDDRPDIVPYPGLEGVRSKVT